MSKRTKRSNYFVKCIVVGETSTLSMHQIFREEKRREAGSSSWILYTPGHRISCWPSRRAYGLAEKSGYVYRTSKCCAGGMNSLFRKLCTL